MMIVSLVLTIVTMALYYYPYDYEDTKRFKIGSALSGAAFLSPVPWMQCAANTFYQTRTRPKGTIGCRNLAWLCYILVNISTVALLLAPGFYENGFYLSNTAGGVFAWICMFMHAESQRKYSPIPPTLSNDNPEFPLSLPMGNNEPIYRREV